MMILKFAIILAFGLIGAVAGPYEEAEGIRTLNFTRPVEVCADSNPQRMYYSGEQSFNFTEFYFANKFHKSAEYGLSLTWAKDYMFGDALVSRKGNRDINALNWRCLRRCLVMDHCASFVLLKDLNENRKNGFHQCQFFSKPIRREYLEIQDSTSESRVMRVYNLVCPENVQDYFRRQANTSGKKGVAGGPFGDVWQDWETEDGGSLLPDGSVMRNDQEKVKEWKEMQREKEDRLKEEQGEDEKEAKTEVDGDDNTDTGDAKESAVQDHESDKADKPRPKDRGKDSVGRNKNKGSGKDEAQMWSKEPKEPVGHPGEMFPHQHKDGAPNRDPDHSARVSWLNEKRKRSGTGPDDAYFVVKAATDRNKAYKGEVDIIPDYRADDQFVDRQGFRGLEPQGTHPQRGHHDEQKAEPQKFDKVHRGG